MSILLEKHIIDLLKAKDEKGMTLLYNHYADTLYGVALKITNNEALAQDSLQEGLIKVWNKIDAYNPEKAKLFTWLFRIIRNTAIDKLRSEKNKTHSEIQIHTENVYTVETTPYKPEHIDVKAHVDALDDKYSIVLDALFFKGLTQQEASKALDIPLGTVKSRLKIGLRELRKIFTMVLIVLILFVLML